MLSDLKRAVALRVALPYIRRELPGWGRIYNVLVGSHRADRDWQKIKPRWLRGKLHGYEMRLDLSGWSNRKTYFLGRFYDLATQSVLKAILRPGDTFVDIGANEGMMSLLAARLVGPSGKVIAFEPNPVPRGILEAAIARNRIEQIELRPVGLSDADATLTLSVPRSNSGEGSFGRSAYHDDDLVEVECAVRQGDAQLANVWPNLIKIDVEGFEENVLRGIAATLARTHCPIVTEVVALHLERADSSVAALQSIMAERGYRGFYMGLARSGWKHRLALTTARFHPGFSGDILWLHEDDERLRDVELLHHLQ